MVYIPTIGYLTVESHCRFVGPAPRHVPDGVATSAKKQQRNIVTTHEVYTLGVTCERQRNVR